MVRGVVIIVGCLLGVALGCKFNGVSYADGDVFNSGGFQVRCHISADGWDTQIVGCFVENQQLIAVGEQKTIGQYTYACEKLADNTVQMRRSQAPPTFCVDSAGLKHQIGEVFVSKQYFEKKCLDDGSIGFVGCIAPNGEKIAQNSAKSIRGVEYHCESNGNQINFYTGKKRN